MGPQELNLKKTERWNKRARRPKVSVRRARDYIQVWKPILYSGKNFSEIETMKQLWAHIKCLQLFFFFLSQGNPSNCMWELAYKYCF